MKKISKLLEDHSEQLVRNKIDDKTKLFINIKCDFCNYRDEYKCENDVANREERWLAVETFIQNGWDELIVPDKRGISCPNCIDKWKNGDWYIKENKEFDENFEDFDEEEIEPPKIRIQDVKMIDVSQWNKLVSEVYDRPYHFQQQQGCKERGIFRMTIPSKYTEDELMHDNIPEIINGGRMGVKFDTWLERDPNAPFANGRKDIKLFWYRNFYPDIHTLANNLHKRGFIEAGKYVINIDW